MSEMVVVCYNPRLHTNVRTTDTITNFGWTVLPHLPFSPGLTCVGSRKDRKKESFRRHGYASDEALQNVTLSGCKWALFIGLEYRFVFKDGRRLLTKN